MVYQPTKPQPNDNLDVSVTDIQQNFLTANTVMGIDHYPFDNVTANKGFHKTVTSPDQTTEPTTTLEPKIYGLQQTVPLGVIQYSKLPNDGVPTPLTNLQSPAAAIVLGPLATTNILDCTGLARMMATVYAFDNLTLTNGTATSVFWNGTAFQIGVSANLKVQASGNILQLRNASTTLAMNVFWTLDIHRAQ